MSYQDGLGALNLEMPPRVPRTEYSAEMHYDLMKVVTGIDVSFDSSEEIKCNARKAFYKAWNYDFYWNVWFHTERDHVSKMRTSMGHAEYASQGIDFDNNIHCPFKSPQDVLKFDPWEVYGKIDKNTLIKGFEDDYKTVTENKPDGINMTGIYCTLISGLIEIFGWEMLLMAAGTDSKAFGEVANRYASWIQQYTDAVAESNVPFVMIHDDIAWTSGPFISPDWYREYVFPNYKKLFASIIESGKRISFTSDGTYDEFIDDIADCGVHGFVLEPTTNMKYIAEKYGKTHYFIGNADTRILLQGTPKDIRNEVKRCMDIGKSCPGFFMAVGNHIPANTPLENALYYNECYEDLSMR
ncbi:MAG: hypothetical protein NTV31_17255 [Bacteroidia bacterium]|nr:hypothetical protein [Bacteroidia bacterium]